MKDSVLKAVGAVTLFVALLVVLGLTMGFPTKWMVNYLFTTQVITAVFGVAQLTFWKAFWLDVLAASLFKSYVKVK